MAKRMVIIVIMFFISMYYGIALAQSVEEIKWVKCLKIIKGAVHKKDCVEKIKEFNKCYPKGPIPEYECTE